MTKRRSFIVTALLIGLAPLARSAAPGMIVYKSAACGCCGEWEKHMRLAGLNVDSRPIADVGAVKRRLGVPQALASCHTAVVDGYVVEGHVPAEDVKRLLGERPRAIGIAVPGMPAGAPGMEQGASQPYTTVAFDSSRHWVFQRH